MTNKIHEHPGFKKLKHIIGFYDSLSFTAFDHIHHMFGTIHNVDAHFLQAISNTYKSIEVLMKKGHFNDVYALLRKVIDAGYMCVYFIIESEKHAESIDIFTDPLDSLLRPAKIIEWCKSNHKSLSISKIAEEIKKFPALSEIYEKFDIETNEKYKRIRDRCNDHTHYNNMIYTFLNNEIPTYFDTSFLNHFFSDISLIFIENFSYLYVIR